MTAPLVMRGRRPLVMYHGTGERFERFCRTRWDSDRGFFFSPRLAYARQYARGEGGRVISAHLAMSNPYRCTETDWAYARGLDLDEAREAGHDGYVVAPYALGTMFIVWDPDAIHILSHDLDAEPFRPTIQENPPCPQFPH